MSDQASNIPIQPLDYFNQPLAPYVDPNPPHRDLSEGFTELKIVRPVDRFGASSTSEHCLIIIASVYDPFTNMVTREAFIPVKNPEFNDFVVKRVINPSKDDLPDYVQVGRSYRIPRAQEAVTGRTLENLLHRMNDETRKARNSKRFDGYDPVIATTLDMIGSFAMVVHGDFGKTRNDLQAKMAPYLGIAEGNSVVSPITANHRFPATGVLAFYGPDRKVCELFPGSSIEGNVVDIHGDTVILSVPIRSSATVVTNEVFMFSIAGILENVSPKKRTEVADLLKPGSDTVVISSPKLGNGRFVLDFKNVGRKQVPVVDKIRPGVLEIKPGWSR